MKIKRIWKIYFSATGTTQKIVGKISQTIADGFGLEELDYDFTLPTARQSFPQLDENDLVVFGCPTYAGRLPNLLLSYLNTICGGNALVVPVVTYGNRNFDNSLAELFYLLNSHDFRVVGAGAFSCEHSFSSILGAGRPDAFDLEDAENFAAAISGKLTKFLCFGELQLLPAVDGDPQAPYYQPQDRHGVHIDIRKVKPKVSPSCILCGKCAEICPMGSIEISDAFHVSGICIKCGSCIKKCPHKALYFDDPGYIYHKEELESLYGAERANNKLFI